ncbi:tRNA (adenosine(37)-N6)-dimethylallyltransferase MiaA [Candidatus Kaiserbacteria bacterium]|nr:tRNA (adenosine(37)-N6)-dimethylallyltransferase MiaA [Candidatus Kaiserbacteria bacterium]
MEGVQKVLVVVGATASGKSALGIELARQFDGEIISADSRQVYRGLDIGTGKVTAEEMQGVPHHLLDVADPQDTFTAHDFVVKGRQTIADIALHGKLPIIVGGTGFYIDALLGRISLANAPRDEALRATLADVDTEDLQALLQEADPSRFEHMNESDRKNPVRLIRALEVATTSSHSTAGVPAYDTLWLGIRWPKEELAARIEKRLDDRLAHGMISEAEQLHTAGLSYERMGELGLEYGWLARFLRGDVSKQEMHDGLLRDIIHYAKRQETWWKRNPDIHWIAPNTSPEQPVQDWLRNA